MKEERRREMGSSEDVGSEDPLIFENLEKGGGKAKGGESRKARRRCREERELLMGRVPNPNPSKQLRATSHGERVPYKLLVRLLM